MSVEVVEGRTWKEEMKSNWEYGFVVGSREPVTVLELRRANRGYKSHHSEAAGEH